MAISNGPTSELCRWVCSTQYQDLPAEVRKEITTLLYDQVGCMIACATLPSCQPVVNLARKLGSLGECSIVGHPVRTSVTNAAMANGTIGHGSELDATGQHGTGHYAATIVPTALTVGQYVGASGTELCRALGLGSEVAARIQSTLGHGTDDAFAPNIGTAIGVAVTAGLLLCLDAEQMEQALGLAASGAFGLSSCNSEELHQIKSLNHGRAAEAGVHSALLAQEGFHGPREVLTIENGFFDAFLGRPGAGREVVEKLGENYLMRQIAYKRYPVGGLNQTALHAFLRLMRTHQLTALDMEQIEVSVSRYRFNFLITNKPTALHMETILSLAAVYGEVTLAHVHDCRYREDPRVKTFQEKTRIFIIPRPDEATMGQRLETGITVRTRNGKTLHQELRYPLMTEAEVQQKFRNLVGLRLDSAAVANLERKLMAIESTENVALLVRELELPY